MEADELDDVQLEKAAGMHRRIVDIWQKGMGRRSASTGLQFSLSGTSDMLERTPEFRETNSLRTVYQCILTQLGERESSRGLKDIWRMLDAPTLSHSVDLNYRHQTFSLDARYYDITFDEVMTKHCLWRIFAFIRAVADKQGVVITYSFREYPPKPWDPVREVARLFVKYLGPVMLHGLLYGSKEQAIVAMHAAKIWIQADPERVIYWANVIGPLRFEQLYKELLDVCKLLDYL